MVCLSSIVNSFIILRPTWRGEREKEVRKEREEKGKKGK